MQTIRQTMSTIGGGMVTAAALFLLGRPGSSEAIMNARADDSSRESAKGLSASQLTYVDVGDLDEDWGGDAPKPRPE